MKKTATVKIKSTAGTETLLKVNRWTKHGKDRLYFEGMGFYYDVNEQQWVNNGAPQLNFFMKQIDVIELIGETQ